MCNATLTATYAEQAHRVVLRLTAPPADGGTLRILTLSLRDPLAPARAVEFLESADALVADGTLDVLSYDPDGAAVLAAAFGV